MTSRFGGEEHEYLLRMGHEGDSAHSKSSCEEFLIFKYRKTHSVVTISFLLPLMTSQWFMNQAATRGCGFNNMSLTKFCLAMPLWRTQSVVINSHCPYGTVTRGKSQLSGSFLSCKDQWLIFTRRYQLWILLSSSFLPCLCQHHIYILTEPWLVRNRIMLLTMEVIFLAKEVGSWAETVEFTRRGLPY